MFVHAFCATSLGRPRARHGDDGEEEGEEARNGDGETHISCPATCMPVSHTWDPAVFLTFCDSGQTSKPVHGIGGIQCFQPCPNWAPPSRRVVVSRGHEGFVS